MPSEFYVLFYLSLSRFYVLAEEFFLDDTQLRHYRCLNSLHAFKTGLLDFSEFEVKKKKFTRQYHVNKNLFQYGDVLDKEISGAFDFVNTCFVVVKQPRFVRPKVSSLLHQAKQTSQEFFVDLVIERLVL